MPLGAFKAALMGTAGVSTADVVLIQSQTSTGATSIIFTSGIDSTYGEYIFKFYNINPVSDAAFFEVQFSVDGGSNYGLSKVSTYWGAGHTEADATSFGYEVDFDRAGGTATADQAITNSIGNLSDESMHGELHLFNPSSTTYVKHFYSRTIAKSEAPGAKDYFISGFVNNTDNIDTVKFKLGTSAFDGTIKMWGVK
jgi:hypothetical protein